MSEAETLYPNAVSLFDFLEKEKGFAVSAPVDVDAIAEALGIIVESDMSLEEKNIIGQISFREDTPIVKINPFQNSYKPRRRFTLAHEIGHYCLHSAKSKQSFTDSQKTMSRTSSYWHPCESEANNFAAQLLMPQKLIIEEGGSVIEKYLETRGGDQVPISAFIEIMANKFIVSSKAMEYRLRNLGIIKN